jgi:hypothetical protein
VTTTLIVRLVLEGKPKLPREILMISLTLGGGYGFLTGRHGLTIDNLVGATVVIADGQVLQVNKDKNQDVSSYPVPDIIRAHTIQTRHAISVNLQSHS